MKNLWLLTLMLSVATSHVEAAARAAAALASAAGFHPREPVFDKLKEKELSVDRFLATAKTEHIKLSPVIPTSVFSEQISDHYPYGWQVKTGAAVLDGFSWNIMGEGGWNGFMDHPLLCNSHAGKTYGAFVPGRSSANIALSGPSTTMVIERLSLITDIICRAVETAGILCLQEVSFDTLDATRGFLPYLTKDLSARGPNKVFQQKIYDDDWSVAGGGKIKLDYGVVVVVNPDRYHAERILSLAAYPYLARAVLLGIRQKCPGEGAKASIDKPFDAYLLAVHLQWDDPSKSDVYGGVMKEIEALRKTLTKPLIITGDFNRDISKYIFNERIAIKDGSVVARSEAPDKFEFQTNDGVMYIP